MSPRAVALVAILVVLSGCSADEGDTCADLERQWSEDAGRRTEAEWAEAFASAGCDDALFFEL